MKSTEVLLDYLGLANVHNLKSKTMYQHQWNKIAEEINFNLEIDVDLFLQYIPLEFKILDFGCGYGRISKRLLDLGYTNIVGIDSSTKMIARGQREFPELELDVSVGETLPYSDNSFDAIIACAVFTCITSQKIRDNHVKELCRTLKPDGILHMVEFCSEPRKSFTASIGIPMLYSTPKELRKLVSMLNIVNEEVVNSNTISGNQESICSIFAKNSFKD